MLDLLPGGDGSWSAGYMTTQEIRLARFHTPMAQNGIGDRRVKVHV